jgi:uncharacterized protein (TIGR02246 family)
MRRFSLLMVGVFVVVALAPLGSEAVAGLEEDVEAINKVREMEAASINDANPDHVSDIYAKDVDYTPPGEAALKGTDAVRQWLVAMLEQVDGELEYTESDVRVVGDWAFEQYAAVVTMTPKAGGESMTENLRGMHIYHRGEDGSWKITHDIWNSDTPRAAE